MRKNNIQYPEKGTYENLFQRLSDYISMFDNTWIERIKPASNESVDLLMKISEIEKWNWKFPRAYQIYLDHMGADDGGLISKVLAVFTGIEDIIDLYENFQKFEPEVFDIPFFSFFQRHMGGELSFDLSGKHFENIMDSASGEFLGVVSESFEKLLFQCAHYRYEINKYYVTFSAKEHCFEICETIVNNYGLNKAWFSDCKNYIGLGEDISFRLHNVPGIFGSITGDNQKLVNEVSELFVSKANAKIQSRNKHPSICR